MAGEFASEARVVMDFHHEAVGFEARAAVESNRVGVVEMAGVHPKPRDGFFPMPLQWRYSSVHGLIRRRWLPLPASMLEPMPTLPPVVTNSNTPRWGQIIIWHEADMG